VECKEKEGGGRKTVFFFFVCSLSSEEVNELRKDYFNHVATVEPKTFAQRQVDVRDILHQALRQR